MPLAAAPLAAVVPGEQDSAIAPDEIIDLFEPLPGDKAVKIFAPAALGKPEFLAHFNSDKRLFVASADKTYLLCEALRQADSPEVIHTLETTDLALNSSVWSFGSPTFNQPNLTGIVSERTTMEAMITRSDNTATDMLFKLAGADDVRKFIASAGLKNTLVPDSTRALTAYLFGAPNYLTITWDELQNVVQNDQKYPFLNNVETLASSTDDFVSYYSRALQGQFFRHPETLREFRRILTLCDFIYLVRLPLGVSAYAKGGNADTKDFHARSIAGGISFAGHWVHFAFIINWYAASQDDPETVSQFFSAIHKSLTRLKNSLSSDCG
jgi:beta-lactamase class A